MAYQFKNVMNQLGQGQQQTQSGPMTQSGQPGIPQQAPPPQQKPPEQKSAQDFTKSKGTVSEALLAGNKGEAATGAIQAQTKQRATTQADKINVTNQDKANQYVASENQKLAQQSEQVRNVGESVADFREGREDADDINAIQQGLGEQYQAGELSLDQGDVGREAQQDLGSFLQQQKAGQGYTLGQANLDTALFNREGGAKAEMINALNKKSSEVAAKRKELSNLPKEQQAKGEAQLKAIQNQIRDQLRKVKQGERDKGFAKLNESQQKALEQKDDNLRRMESQYGKAISSEKPLSDPALEQIRQRYKQLKGMSRDDYLNSVGLQGSDDLVRSQESAGRLNTLSQLLGEQANYKAGDGPNDVMSRDQELLGGAGGAYDKFAASLNVPKRLKWSIGQGEPSRGGDIVTALNPMTEVANYDFQNDPLAIDASKKRFQAIGRLMSGNAPYNAKKTSQAPTIPGKRS